MWGIPTREGLGGNVPSWEFEGMDDSLKGVRFLLALFNTIRIKSANKNKKCDEEKDKNHQTNKAAQLTIHYNEDFLQQARYFNCD